MPGGRVWKFCGWAWAWGVGLAVPGEGGAAPACQALMNRAHRAKLHLSKPRPAETAAAVMEQLLGRAEHAMSERCPKSSTCLLHSRQIPRCWLRQLHAPSRPAVYQGVSQHPV